MKSSHNKAELENPVQTRIEYPNGSLYDEVYTISKKYPDFDAYIFMGRKTSYRAFIEKVHECAKALKSIGVREGDSVTIALPNCPQAIQVFYAVNIIGGIANMIHPLASENETLFCLKEADSRVVICLDSFYKKFENVKEKAFLRKIIITGISYELNPLKKIAYYLKEGHKIDKVKPCKGVLTWSDFLNCAKNYKKEYKAKKYAQDSAVILYSGGTTGVKKGVLLTNLNLNAVAKQLKIREIFEPGNHILTSLPMFHGFGLVYCVHGVLWNASTCILSPRFSPKSCAKLILKYKCRIIPHVPSFFESIIDLPVFNNKDLSYLKEVFIGGDTISVNSKAKIDNFLKSHNAFSPSFIGYGLTECSAACSLSSLHFYREHSLGYPLPGMNIKIVKPGTHESLKPGTEGQIVISGPNVMKKYINNPKETARVLQVHSDGLTWFHTDDIGMFDEDGFLYFKERMNRMFIKKGYNIYPNQLEQVLSSFEGVEQSCVIGIRKDDSVKKIKAYIVLADTYMPNDETKDKIFEYAKSNISKYEMINEIEFIESLPMTSIGKVDYCKLEAEEGL
ncbi:MAG: acyl--CoA ligase [Enterococcus sp.]|nr:acyl--CoA ligase [Enterococcus sp.]